MITVCCWIDGHPHVSKDHREQGDVKLSFISYICVTMITIVKKIDGFYEKYTLMKIDTKEWIDPC